MGFAKHIAGSLLVVVAVGKGSILLASAGAGPLITGAQPFSRPLTGMRRAVAVKVAIRDLSRFRQGHRLDVTR